MFLAVDIGNSNIVISIYHDGKWTNTSRYESKDNQPALYYINGLSEILLEWVIAVTDIKSAAISSVVPHLNEKIITTIKTVTGIVPHLIGPDDFQKLDMHVPLIYEIGSDLVANSVAALHNYQSDSLIIDFGTALTFTVVSKKKGIEGVTFAPGLKTAMLSLSGNTAQLPEVWLEWPKSALGQNTNDAIRAGVLIGYLGLVKEIKSRILYENTHIQKVIGTGGLVSAIPPLVDEIDIIDSHLTLDGIRLLSTLKLS